jgi:hypothetical protein
LHDAVQALIVAWKDRHPGDLSIPVYRLVSIQSTFAGTCRKSAYNVRSIKVDRLFIIVKASLSSHYFSALGSIWRQIRGAGIGSQIGPRPFPTLPSPWRSKRGNIRSRRFSVTIELCLRFAAFGSVIAKSDPDPIVIYSDPNF